MPYCPECGEGVDDGHMFCPGCGHDLDDVGERSAGNVRSGDTGQSAGAEQGAWGTTNTEVGRSHDEAHDARKAEPVDESVTGEPTDPIPTAEPADEVDEVPVERTTNVDGESPFTDGPLSMAIGYATRQSRDPVLIGGIIEFAGLIVPFISMMVRGFGFRVATAIARGQTEPPEFDDYGEMFVDGLRIMGLGFLFLVVFGLIGGILGILGFYVHEVLGAVLVLFVFGVGFYLFPASLTAYAAHGTIEHAISPSYAGAFALTATYLKSYLVYVVVSIGVSVLFTIALVTVVGILALPFLIAWSIYAYASVWGYYYREAVEREEVPPAPAEAV